MNMHLLIRSLPKLLGSSIHYVYIGCFVLVLALALLVTPAQATAQTTPPEAVVWTSLGPPGGNCGMLAIDPQVPTTLYSGSGETIYRSNDSGATWRALGITPPGLDSGNSFADIVVDQQIPSTLYVATRYQSIFHSIDGGVTWEVGIAEGLYAIGQLAVDPHCPGTLYALDWFGSIYRSNDNAVTWERISSGLPPGHMTLILDPQRIDILYLATGEGVLRSIDGGVTWQSISNGLPTGYVYTLALDPENSDVLYAGLQAGLYQSTDSGENWQIMTNSLTLGQNSSILIDPENPSTLYAGTLEGLYRSTDGGTNWQALGGEMLVGVNVTSLVVNPQAPAELYVGSWTRGVLHSVDGGATWENTNVGFIPGINAIAIDPQNPVMLYVATGEGDVARTSDGGGSWRYSSTPISSIIHTVVLNPQHTATIYAATFLDGVFRSVDEGASWSAVNTGLTYTSTDSFAIDPQTPTTLFVSTIKGIFRSRNGGDSWSQVSTCNGHNVAISPQQPAMIYAVGFLPFFLCRSEDGGDTWQTIQAEGPQDTPVLVRSLLVDPHQPTQLYAASWANGVSRSSDGGETWTTVNNGLTNLEVNSLVVSAVDPVTLYASTPNGIFRSTNSGDSWTLAASRPRGPQANYPFSHLLAIDPQTPTKLYSASHSNGLFVTDFETAGPMAVTNAAYNVRNTSATLVGTVGASNAAVQFAVTSAIGNYSTVTTLPAGAATIDDPLVSVRTIGLQPGATYYYRVVATADTATAYGGEQSFTTAPTLPVLAASNDARGAPGSVFLLQATNFAPYSHLAIAVNGWVVGTIPVAATGQARLALAFADTAPLGVYRIGVAEQVAGNAPVILVAGDAEVQLTLDAAAPQLVDTSGATVIAALSPTLYLPLIER
jgi:photosystem II stability/assembly factor-like uncharacterized protein